MIADMDSTIIENECIDELATVAGVGEQVAAITEAAMRGELDFESALRERVGMLDGLPETALQQVYDNNIRLTPGARALVQTMRANGAKTVLVSGGFTFFTSLVAQAAGFDEHYANTLEIEDGALTGRIVEPILGADAKLQTLRTQTESLGIEPGEVLALGDGANDIPMIEEAGMGVAFCAMPAVAQAAGTQIAGRDLRTLLFMQGYSSEDFVE